MFIRRIRLKKHQKTDTGTVVDNKAGHICPVCGQFEFSESGSFEICPVCRWEDDNIQSADPDFAGGANSLSLNEYRKKYLNEH